MIIYEVNLTVDITIFDDYLLWLKEHVEEILRFDGFMSAEIGLVKDEGLTKTKVLRVSYHVESEKQLEDYLTHHAAAMRSIALEKFGDRFSASRRVIYV